MKISNAGMGWAGAAAGAAAWQLWHRRERYPVRDRVVLVTGSSRGFGLALAERFARAGARVVLTARSAQSLETARNLLIHRGAVAPDHVLAVPCDLREQPEVRSLFRTIQARWAPVEVLVNNAGIMQVGPIESQPVEAYEEALRTNYLAMLYCSLAALPAMLRRREGAIVNIASIGGKVAVPHLLPYSASKFACVGFSQGLRAEVRRKGIRVTTVTPGLLRTGSPIHASFTGAREEEFRWFNLGASLPGLSRDVYQAAGRVLRGAQRGEAEFSITPQAAVAARFAGLFPGATTSLLSLVNSVALPAPDPNASEPMEGEAVQAKDVRALTGGGRYAARHWNQQ